VGGAGDITLAAQTGGGTITKNGAGTLTLGTAQDTFDNDSVAVVVNAGRVVLAKPSTTTIHALGGTSTVNAGILQLAGTGPDQLFYGMQLKLNGGLLDLNGRNGVVSTLVSDTPTIAGTVANNATGVSTFTVGGNANGGNGTSTFFGQLVDNTNAGAGQLRLEKDGTGTFNLAAAAGYTGGTAVTRGTLNIGANGYVGSLLGEVAVATGATLGLNRMDDFTFANAVTGAGNLAVNGSGKVTVSGANTYLGATTVNAGRLLLGAASTEAVTGALGANAGALVLTAGVLDLNGFSLAKGAVSGAAGFQVINNGATPATLTLGVGNVAGTLAADLNDGASTLALRKVGTGALTIQGNSFYTGGVTVEAGRLVLGSNTALGRGTTVTVLSGASLDINNTYHGNADNGARRFNVVLAGAGDGTAANPALANTNGTGPNASVGI